MENVTTLYEDGVFVEIYQGLLPQKEDFRQARSEVEKTSTELNNLEETMQRCERLGLNAQADMISFQIETLKAGFAKNSIFSPEALGYHQITNDQMTTWKKWLPTEYRKSQLRLYSFDRIPCSVLTAWEAAKELDVFQTFSICTPESQKIQDPILIGWLGDIPYLIARWGESLRPYEEIEFFVKTAEEREHKRDKLRMIFSIGSFALAFLVGFILAFIFMPNEGIFISTLTGIASAFAGLMASIVIMPPPSMTQKYLDKYRQKPLPATLITK